MKVRIERLNLKIHKQIMWLVTRSDFQEAFIFFSQRQSNIFWWLCNPSTHKVLFSSHEEWTGKKSMTIAGVTNWFHNTACWGLIVWISCPTAVVVVSDYQHSSRKHRKEKKLRHFSLEAKFHRDNISARIANTRMLQKNLVDVTHNKRKQSRLVNWRERK